MAEQKEEKDGSFFDKLGQLKTIFAVVVAIFLAGIGSIMYLENRFYTQWQGKMLEQNVEKLEEAQDKKITGLENKVDEMSNKTNTILIELGKIQGQLEKK